MSAQPELIEAEVTDADVVAIAPVAPNLLAAPTGAALIEIATERANALAEVIRKKGLTTRIGKKDHVAIEGWALCGSMMGVFPVPEWCNELRDEDGKLHGFEARVEARTLSGAVVGAAIARCTRSEKTWADRDEFAIESMAQTRAAGKALRLPLAWVMVLAGYEATPAEDMPGYAPKPRARLAKVIKENDVDIEWAKQQMAVRYDGVTSTKDLTDEQVEDFIEFLTDDIEAPF